MKKFNLNGVNVELSKEQLQDMLKEYDEPKWEVRAGEDKDINLYKNGGYVAVLLFSESENERFSLSTISRDMAEYMDDLMETKDALDRKFPGCYVTYDLLLEEWSFLETRYDSCSKHFKTKATAKLAAKLLNESQDMKDWIERMINNGI